MRGWTALIGALMLLGGAACLNYTQAFDFKEHDAWADSHSVPGPSYEVFLAGGGSAILGAGVLGFLMGRKPNKKK